MESQEILKLKELLDGFVWHAGTTDEDFISYWRFGKKSKYLHIKDGMVTTFC